MLLVPVLGCLGLVPEPSGAPHRWCILEGAGQSVHKVNFQVEGCPRTETAPLLLPLSPGTASAW